MMIGTPIFFSNMPKYCYNKLYKRKQKPFTEREGDWICNSCKNLNFAFRVECNRCKLPKGADAKTNSNEDNNNNKDNHEQKTYQKNPRYNKHKKGYNYYYNNKNNGNENGKE
jgi:RNA-binding protein FUS